MSTLRYITNNLDSLGPEAVTQVRIVAIVILISAVTGIGMGVLAARNQRFAGIALAVASTVLTIPSFALFVVLRQWLVLFGDPPVIAGLVLYAQLPMIRNTMAGIRAVSPAVVEAARGM